MNHVRHIQKNKENLDLRWQILRLIREFFWQQNFIEVETPLLLHLPGQEPYLSPMKLLIHDEKRVEYSAFLHTSPEYTLKKMLAAGYEKIFSLCKTFRDYESFGGTHNPEFTLIEWYRAGEDFYALMDDVERLFGFIRDRLEVSNVQLKEGPLLTSPDSGGKYNFTRLHMRDLWQEHVGVNLDEYLAEESMFRLCVEKGFHPSADEPYDDLFNRIFFNLIEPALGRMGAVIVHHYPKQMAALSRLSKTDPRYAERMEVYIDGIEIANGFSELTDAGEQQSRLEGEKSLRQKLGKDVFPIDFEFVEAVGYMPPSTGIALGIDRMVQVFTGCKNLNDVLPLPASQLFEKL